MNDDRTMRLRVRAPAPLARVWQALTSPSQLETWLAEHAEVDLPRAFTFWGRYTPEGELAHQRLLYADDHTLRFTWTLGGEDTTVEIHVEPDGADASVVSVSQTHYDFQQALAESSSLSVIETFWSFSLGNLVDFLAGRGVGYRCDFTSSDLRAELEIDAPRERIYAALSRLRPVQRVVRLSDRDRAVGRRTLRDGWARRTAARPTRGHGEDRRSRARPQDGGGLRRRRRLDLGARGQPGQDAAHLRPEWIQHAKAAIRGVARHTDRTPLAAALRGGARRQVHLRGHERGHVAISVPGWQRPWRQR